MKIKPDIEEIIIRYLNGELSDGDRQQILEWIDSSEDNHRTYCQIKDIWDTLIVKEDRSEAALLQFYKQQAHDHFFNQKVLKLWKVAASIAAVIAIAFISHFVYNLNVNEQVAVVTESTMVTIKVPLGSKSEVVLADGSSVKLNSGTQLQYPGQFLAGKREVYLKGEAYFSVHSDSANPFIVRTDDYNVQATGTQFNVCSYDDDGYSSVTLEEGTVSIMFNDESIVDISPAQKLCLNRDNRNYQILSSDVRFETAWKEGEFRFKEIGFPLLIKKLERWYDVKLSHTSPELKTMLYSGNFKNQETIWQVLDALTLTAPIEYKKNGFREFEIIYKPMK